MSFRKIFTEFIPKNKKRCSKCKKIKDRKEFHKDKSKKDGLNSTCKPCNTINTRESGYKRRYGITKEQYYEMYSNQHGNCSICGRHFDLLCVDHNHKTGKVRSLLCRQCNYNLGVYRETISVFESFVDYIKLHNVD